jgi:hypothetical protein
MWIVNIDKDLTIILNTIKTNRSLDGEGAKEAILGDLYLFEIVKKLWKSIPKSLKNIRDSGILESLESIKDSHSINEMLNALSGGSKIYSGKDLIYTTTSASGSQSK